MADEEHEDVIRDDKEPDFGDGLVDIGDDDLAIEDPLVDPLDEALKFSLRVDKGDEYEE